MQNNIAFLFCMINDVIEYPELVVESFFINIERYKKLVIILLYNIIIN